MPNPLASGEDPQVWVIIATRINQCLDARLDFAAFGLAGFGVGWAGTVIGLLEPTMWLSHC